MDLNALITMGLLVLGPKIISDYSISCSSANSKEFVMMTFNNEPHLRIVSSVRAVDNQGAFELIDRGETELQSDSTGTHRLITPKTHYTWVFPRSRRESFQLTTSSGNVLECIYLR